MINYHFGNALGIFGSIICLSLAPPCFAQLYEYSYFPSVYSSQPFTNTLVIDVVEEERQRRGSNSQASSIRETAPVKAELSVALRKLAYSPSLVRRKTSLSKFADQLKIKNSADTEKVRAIFTDGDVIAQMNDIMGSFGLRADNVADAYTVWWVSAWQGANGDSNAPTRAQFQAVKTQVIDAMASNPQLLNATNAQKQETAEALLMQAAMIDGTTELVKDDPVALRNLQAGIRKGARAYGVDLDVFDLKPTGFTLSGKVIGAIQKDIAPGV